MVKALELHAGEVVSIAGMGGKTALLYALAREVQRALLSTTTRVWPPSSDQVDYTVDHMRELTDGVTFFSGGEDERGKLFGPPLAALHAASKLADLTLIESDGSRGLPLKGWRDDEPVLADFTDVTICVLTLWPLGQAVSDALVCRPELFCDQTGASCGKTLTLDHFARVCAVMAGRAVGRCVLFINQVESEEALVQAKALARRADVRALPIERIVAGSAWNRTAEVLWKKN